VICACLVFPVLVQAQMVRYENMASTTNAPQTPGGYPQLLVIPGATITVCNTNTNPCNSLATTYTDATGNTACPTSAQMTMPGSSTCVATTDNQGNIGWWAAPGTYYFSETIGTHTYGPYAASLPIGTGAANTFGPLQTMNGGIATTSLYAEGTYNDPGSTVLAGLAATGPMGKVSNPGGAVWPGLVTLPNGHLFAVYMASGGGAIHGSISTDGGQTWVADTNTPPLPAGDTAYYASMTLLQNGNIFLAYSVADATSQLAQPGYMIGIVSGDTITWGPLNTIPVSGQSYCYDDSPVLQLPNGNLLLHVWCQGDATQNYSAMNSGIMISSDGGTTWSPWHIIGASISVVPGVSTNGYDEGAFVRFTNGDVVAILRHTNPGDPQGSFARAISTDGGVTWSAPTETLNTGNLVGRPSVIVGPGQRLILVSRMAVGLNMGGTGGVVSADEGVTWTPIALLEPYSGTDEYEALTMMSDGVTIGMVVCWHGIVAAEVRFTTLTTSGMVGMNGAMFGKDVFVGGTLWAGSVSDTLINTNAIPVGTVSGELYNSRLYATGPVISTGKTQSAEDTTDHGMFYFHDFDSTAGYPRVAWNTAGPIWGMGDDTAGDAMFGTVNLTTSAWIAQLFKISQTGDVSVSGAVGFGPTLAANDVGISRVAAGTIALGNGTSGDTSGTISLTYVNAPGGYLALQTAGVTRVSVHSSGMYPELDNVYDLGLPTMRWRNLMLSGTVTKYNGVTTAGFGLAPMTYSNSFAPSGAGVPTTTIASGGTSGGIFRVTATCYIASVTGPNAAGGNLRLDFDPGGGVNTTSPWLHCSDALNTFNSIQETISVGPSKIATIAIGVDLSTAVNDVWNVVVEQLQ